MLEFGNVRIVENEDDAEVDAANADQEAPAGED